MLGQIPHGSDVRYLTACSHKCDSLDHLEVDHCRLQKPWNASEYVSQVWFAFYSTTFKLLSISLMPETAGSIWHIITK